MRTNTLFFRSVSLTFLLAAGLLSLQAAAQDRPANLIPIPAIPPPPPGMVGDDLEPQITITKRGDDKVEEHRVNGKLYMMKVTPSHGVPYYLVDEKGDGNWTPKDTADAAHIRVPMWVIGTF
jgi:hypothetical protein